MIFVFSLLVPVLVALFAIGMEQYEKICTR